MIDPLAAAMSALTSRSPAAIGLVFLAGLLTSIGPCIGPRYVAIAAITGGRRRPFVATAAFVAGLIGAFVTLGFGAGLLGSLWSISRLVYLALATALVGGGCVALIRAVPPAAEHACCQAGGSAPADRSLGGIFLLGAAGALVISPCCTPIVAAIVATSTATGQPAIGCMLLLSFALGHALPLFAAGSLSPLVDRLLPRRFTAQAPAIVGAVLMLALGAYYGILA